MDRQRLNRIDTVLLRAEHPSNPMTITGVLTFASPLDYDRLVETIEQRLLPIDRFRQRAVEDPRASGRYSWEPDPAFDLDYHLQQAELPASGDQAALQDLVSRLASAQLNLDRPLWQLHLVDVCNPPTSAIICRVHHALADGIALVQVLLSLTDPDPEIAPSPPPLHQDATIIAGDLGAGKAAGRQRGWGLGAAPAAALRAARRGARFLSHPRSTLRAARSRAAALVTAGVEAAETLATLFLYEPEPDTPLKGALTGTKAAAWSDPVPLHDVKRIGRRLGGTVNDVLIAALSGALRRYLHAHQVPGDGTGLRAVVPVNTRSAGELADLTNDIGLLFLSLPTSTEDPVDSLAQVRQRMDRLKDSLEPAVTKGLLLALGGAPVGLQNALFNILGTKASALVTNVIGPRERRYLAGAPLDSLMFWVPQSGGVGLGISILSYAGQVRIGVLADRHLVPDPAAIVSAFQVELGRLLAIADSREEPATVRGMIATLDRALEGLSVPPAPHGGLAGQNDGARATAPRPRAPRARCQGVTRAGERCKRPPSPGSSYCHLHASVAPIPGEVGSR